MMYKLCIMMSDWHMPGLLSTVRQYLQYVPIDLGGSLFKSYVGSAVEKTEGTETPPLAKELAGEVICGKNGDVDGC